MRPTTLVNPYPADVWNQDYARQALRWETRLEKALEGERFFDLVRWGIVETTMNKYIAAESDNRIYYANAHFTGGKDEYYPVPNKSIRIFWRQSMYRIPVMLRSTNYILK